MGTVISLSSGEKEEEKEELEEELIKKSTNSFEKCT
jgi:hypothetical protein